MKTRARLWALCLIAGTLSPLLLPAAAFAATPPPFPTCNLFINPSVIGPGDTTNIRWTSTNATGGAITNVGNVGPSGSKAIIPPPAQIVTYVGSFTGPGGTANCQASVQISYGADTGASGASGGSLQNQPVNPNPVQSGASGGLAPAAGGGGTIGGAGTQPALVQCGTGSGAGALNCEACNLAQLVSNIINFAIGLSIPLAAVLFAWAGILYFSSGANPGNKEQAKGIFSNALIGFLIAITAWLVINTLLHVLLNGGQAGFRQGNWFTVQCSSGIGTGVGQRNISGTFSQVLNSILPGVNTNPLVITSNQLQTPPPGGACDVSLGGCFDSSGTAVSSGPGGSCSSGYVYTESATEYWCQNPNNPSDWQETFGPDSYGGTNNPNYSGSGTISSGDIAAAALAYQGANTSAGPDNGNLACAWAVNNVLQSAGIAPIDGNSVYSMEQALIGGRGTGVDQYTAQAGDIVIFGGMSHVGICENAGCTQVLSNSSSNATFTSEYPPTAGSRIYRVNR